MAGTKKMWDHGKWTQKYIYAETLQFSISKSTSDSLEGNVYLSQMILALLGKKKKLYSLFRKNLKHTYFVRQVNFATRICQVLNNSKPIFILDKED